MKSYFLEGIRNTDAAAEILTFLFPTQIDPWVMLSEEGDAMAYFNIVLTEHSELEAPAIQVDISGRHFDCDEAVLRMLGKIAKVTGGHITDDL